MYTIITNAPDFAELNARRYPSFVHAAAAIEKAFTAFMARAWWDELIETIVDDTEGSAGIYIYKVLKDVDIMFNIRKVG